MVGTGRAIGGDGYWAFVGMTVTLPLGSYTCNLRINCPCIPSSAPHGMKWTTFSLCFPLQEVKRDTSQRTCGICRDDIQPARFYVLAGMQALRDLTRTRVSLVQTRTQVRQRALKI
jgi:hypothetical protein